MKPLFLAAVIKNKLECILEVHDAEVKVCVARGDLADAVMNQHFYHCVLDVAHVVAPDTSPLLAQGNRRGGGDDNDVGEEVGFVADSGGKHGVRAWMGRSRENAVLFKDLFLVVF